MLLHPRCSGRVARVDNVAGGSRHILPAQIPSKATDEAMELAVAAHKALGCRGVTRTDFRYDDTGASHRLKEIKAKSRRRSKS